MLGPGSGSLYYLLALGACLSARGPIYLNDDVSVIEIYICIKLPLEMSTLAEFNAGQSQSLSEEDLSIESCLL